VKVGVEVKGKRKREEDLRCGQKREGARERGEGQGEGGTTGRR